MKITVTKTTVIDGQSITKTVTGETQQNPFVYNDMPNEEMLSERLARALFNSIEKGSDKPAGIVRGTLVTIDEKGFVVPFGSSSKTKSPSASYGSNVRPEVVTFCALRTHSSALINEHNSEKVMIGGVSFYKIVREYEVVLNENEKLTSEIALLKKQMEPLKRVEGDRDRLYAMNTKLVAETESVRSVTDRLNEAMGYLRKFQVKCRHLSVTRCEPDVDRDATCNDCGAALEYAAGLYVLKETVA